jgi:hypothetical protein
MAADYAYKFGRVTISGTAFNGAEEWSTGFQLGAEDASPIGMIPGGAQVVANAWETFMELAGHTISGSYRATLVKVALINEDGTTDVDNIDYHNFSTVVTGAYGGNPLPAQVTLAATMTSEYQRGLAAKGRMYLPGVASGVDPSTGKISSTFTNTLNTGFKAFLDTVNAGQTGGAYVILASKGHKTDQLDANGQPVYEGGRAARVTGCRIGDVYDTQRRRRNDLVETYNTKVLA